MSDLLSGVPAFLHLVTARDRYHILICRSDVSNRPSYFDDTAGLPFKCRIRIRIAPWTYRETETIDSVHALGYDNSQQTPMITALLIASLSFSDSTQTLYAQQNVQALKKLLDRADTRVERLLCRYRLYPLTEDPAYLRGLPADLPDGSAREQALLSGLWGYRAAEASFISAIKYGRRSARLLEAAKSQNPEDPFVLLIEGQSLLFRPAIAGRDRDEALRRFRRLQSVLNCRDDTAGVSKLEAQVWTWYALTELGRSDEAASLRDDLLAAHPPSLYRQFLLDPPRS